MTVSRTYGKLAYIGEAKRWAFADVEPHVVIRMKQVFKRIPPTATGIITLPDSLDIAAEIHWFMQRYPMEMTVGDRDQLYGQKELFERQMADLDRILLPDWQPTSTYDFKEGYAPYPYQAQAAALVSATRQLLLMDDVGLGKSFSTMATWVSDKSTLPAALVVQAHLTEQWKEYIENATNLAVHVIKGRTPYSLPKADVYVFRYTNIQGWADIAGRGVFRSFVMDEPQELRHGKATSKGQAAIAFRDHSSLRLGLSATPIYNYGDEMYRVMEYIAPGLLGEWHEFYLEWCEPAPGGKAKVKDPQALGAYLREQNVTLRRTEDDIGGQVPPVNSIAHEVLFDEKVVDDADARARMLAMKVVGGSFAERGSAARELDMHARMTTGIAKARYVADFVRVLLESKVPVLLGGWHRDVYEIWNKELADYRPLMYTGSETSAVKNRHKEEFLSGKSDLIIMSLRSGAGLDGLQFRCSTAVFGEFDWSPQVHKQFYGRLRRPGQKEQVDAIYLWTNGGSDPLIIETHGVKSSQSRGIVDPLAGVEQVHTDESRIKRLAESYLHTRATRAAESAIGDPTVTRLDDRRSKG